MKIELLAPAGSMACLKAAVSKGADAVYLGMRRFSARDFATNFDEKTLYEAVRICRSNNVKLYLTMNTLVKNSEVNDFFNQLSFAYSKGIDGVIIQHVSFIELIKNYFPDLKVHVSTQAGVMNSSHASLLSNADRITLARELTKDEVKAIRDNFNRQLEIFCHGALCVCLSGQCLFSSFLGGRSGNRGKCAQPCRKKYNNTYYLSTKELCLIHEIPEIIKLGIDSVKIEGRMRSPFYVAVATKAYREAVDSYYKGNFKVNSKSMQQLENAFSREFTKGWFIKSSDMFNRNYVSGKREHPLETYEVKAGKVSAERAKVKAEIPEFRETKSSKALLVRVYDLKDGIEAAKAGADIVYMDLFDNGFSELKEKAGCRVFAVTPRIMLDSDIDKVIEEIKSKRPDGILAGNMGILGLGLKEEMHLDYNLNMFNDVDLSKGVMPIISPELGFRELRQLKSRNFAVLVHGKIKLMTLRHSLEPGVVSDKKGEFVITRIHNGSEIVNKKEIGLLGKSSQLVKYGITKFFIDTEDNVGEIVRLYHNILDSKKVNDNLLKKKYVLGWAFKGAA